MPAPFLVIITGPPCTGKTTIGERLAKELCLPFINKDGIKELLFDRLGWSDRPWSKQLSLTSYDLLFYFAEALLRAGRSLIVESNFQSEIATPKFLDLKSRRPFTPIQILCRTDGETLCRRFVQRAESSQRHPGHIDQQTFGELRERLMEGTQPPLEIGGQVLQVDTTDFTAVDFPALLGELAALGVQNPTLQAGQSD